MSSRYTHIFRGLLPDLDKPVRSGVEANIWRCFKWCVEQGLYKSVEYEPEEFCVDPEGKYRRNRYYLPDLRVVELDDRIRVIEVKGQFQGTDGPVKMKRFKKSHPELFRDMIFIGTKPAVKYFKIHVAKAVNVECWLISVMQKQYSGLVNWQTTAEMRADQKAMLEAAECGLPFGEGDTL